MHNKEEFKELTMYEEIAYSITCLEKIYIDWNIKSKKIAAYIEIFWGFTKDFDCWEFNVYTLKNNFEKYSLTEHNNINSKMVVIFNIIKELYAICLGNLYTEYRYTSVLRNIFKIEEYLENNKIQCPNLKSFVHKEKKYKNNLSMLRCKEYCLLNNIQFLDKTSVYYLENHEDIKLKNLDRKIYALKFDNISIRGRFAFGVECLLKVINNFNIESDLDIFVVNLLEFTSCSDLELWDNKIKLLLPKELNNETLSYNLNYDEDLDEAEQLILTKVFLEVLNIGTCNLYKRYDDELTLLHLINIVNLLKKNNIEIPNIEKFKFSSIKEDYGWGNKFECEVGYSNPDSYEKHSTIKIKNI